jgi:hypothetical protein
MQSTRLNNLDPGLQLFGLCLCASTFYKCSMFGAFRVSVDLLAHKRVKTIVESSLLVKQIISKKPISIRPGSCLTSGCLQGCILPFQVQAQLHGKQTPSGRVRQGIPRNVDRLHDFRVSTSLGLVSQIRSFYKHTRPNKKTLSIAQTRLANRGSF